MIKEQEARILPVDFWADGVTYSVMLSRIQNPEMILLRKKDDPEELVMCVSKDKEGLKKLLLRAVEALESLE